MNQSPDSPPELQIKPLVLVVMGVFMALFWGGVMLGVDALGLIDKESGVRNPWPTVALAVVMGVVFPLLWASKMKRRFPPQR